MTDPRRHRKWAAVLGVVVLTATACSGNGDNGSASPLTTAPAAAIDFTGTAAVVDGVEIPASLVQERFELARDNPSVALALLGAGVQVTQPNGAPSPTVINRIMNQELDNQLILAELADRDLEPTEEEFQLAESQIRGSLVGAVDEMPEEFSTLLFTRNANFIALDQALTPERTDEELRAEYERNTTAYTRSCARHVLVNSVEDADVVMAELRDGADFGTVAAERSLDSETKNDGGVLGCIARDELAEGFDDFALALFDGPLDLIQGPVLTPFGLSVVQVQARETPPFEDVRGDVAFDLLPQPMAQLGAWIAVRRSRAEVTVDPRFGVWQPAGGLLLPAAQTAGTEGTLRLEPADDE